MSNELFLAVAGNAAGAGEATYVEDVFSTYLYEGNGGTQSIQNNIQLGDDYGGSIYFPLDSYITSTSNINYHNSTDGSFTIEGWIRRKDSTNSKGIFTLGPDPNIPTGIKLLVRPDSNNRWQIFHDGGYFYSANNTIPAVNVWTHFALVKDGTNDILKLYQNGSEIYSASDTTSYTAQPLKLGYGYSTNYDLVGDLSQFEITKEVKYTGTFTAPTAVSTPGSNTELLIASGTSPDLDVTGTYTFTKTGGVTPLSTSPFSTVITEGKGGLVWIKNRDASDGHILTDTERGVGERLSSNTTSAETTDNDTTTAFNFNGFSIGDDTKVNTNTEDYASWTFAKQEKFFDVVTYTGTGSAQNISHNLGSTPGMIIIKDTSGTNHWIVGHRSLDYTTGKYLILSSTAAVGTTTAVWNNTAPTSSVFTVGMNSTVNTNGNTYVAYLFAHNDGDGIFGENGDQDIIKCGSYTGNSSSLPNTISLGFEPQWVMVKKTNGASDWAIWDTMRGMTLSSNAEALEPNTSDAESTTGNIIVYPTADGFEFNDASDFANFNGNTYIYIAIRRGPMKTPTSGTEVFAPYISDSTAPFRVESGFPVDSWLYGQITSTNKWFLFDRLRGSEYLKTNTTGAEVAYTAYFDDMEQASITGSGYAGYINYAFRRAPGFFDVVAYEGTGVAKTVAHNLGAVPELLITKRRDTVGNWNVYSSGIGASNRLILDQDSASSSSAVWNNTAPTSSVFSLGSNTGVNASGGDFIAYLFATLPGVSKVGTVTHDANAYNDVDCGFANGARFILLKEYNNTGNWWVFDTERGIVSGADPGLTLDTTSAEASYDAIDPLASGFRFNKGYLGVQGDSFIFLAIA